MNRPSPTCTVPVNLWPSLGLDPPASDTLKNAKTTGLSRQERLVFQSVFDRANEATDLVCSAHLLSEVHKGGADRRAKVFFFFFFFYVLRVCVFFLSCVPGVTWMMSTMMGKLYVTFVLSCVSRG